MNLFPVNITGIDVIVIFFKLFGVTFCLMYFVFSIIVAKQIEVMSKTIQVVDTGIINRKNIINFITETQVLIRLILFLFSIIVLLS